MHYSLILAILTAVAVAAPMEMNNMNAMKEAHQAADESYGSYGKYAEYSNYGVYPGGVEEAAKAMGTHLPPLVVLQSDASTAKANMKRGTMHIADTKMMDDAAIADMMRKESMMMEKDEVM